MLDKNVLFTVGRVMGSEAFFFLLTKNEFQYDVTPAVAPLTLEATPEILVVTLLAPSETR